MYFRARPPNKSNPSFFNLRTADPVRINFHPFSQLKDEQ